MSFPLSKHTGGGDTAPAFSGQCVYLQFMWEVGLPSSPVEFSSDHHFYKLSCSWLFGVCRRSYLLQQACLFTAHVGSGSSPPPWEFSSHCHFYKLFHCSWLLGVCCCSCLLQPACCEGFPLPASLALRAPHPLCYVSFLLLLLIIPFFFLFSLGGGWSVQGAMLIWPGLSVGVPRAA
jgi:hypothetical protein